MSLLDDLIETTPSNPWVVLDFKKTPNSLHCTRCGERFEMSAAGGLKINTYIAIGQGFLIAHNECEEVKDGE